MKNYIFLVVVLFVLTFLFTLRYAIGLLDDNTLRITLVATFVVVLVARQKLGINFFK